jgi:drug/metabolite transporter (DMT)-like permease
VALLIKKKVPIRAYSALLLSTLCWGLAPVATRYLLISFTPLQLVLIRFVLAALFFLPLLTPLRRFHWSVKKVSWVVFCGMAGVIGYNVPVAYGLRVIPSSLAGLLIATEPIWILLIAAFVLREKITWTMVIGLLLSVLGITVLFGQAYVDATWNMRNFAGALLILLAAFMWAMYTVSVRRLSKEVGARTATALTMIVGTFPLLTWWDSHTWSLLRYLSGAAWIALVLLTVGSTVAATILWNYGVAYTTSSQASIFLYLIPLISIIGGTLFLHEHTSILTLLSGLLILGGIALGQLVRPGRAKN